MSTRQTMAVSMAMRIVTKMAKAQTARMGVACPSEEDRSVSEHYYFDFKDVHPGHYQYKFRVGQDEHQWVLDESADIGEST